MEEMKNEGRVGGGGGGSVVADVIVVDDDVAVARARKIIDNANKEKSISINTQRYILHDVRLAHHGALIYIEMC